MTEGKTHGLFRDSSWIEFEDHRTMKCASPSTSTSSSIGEESTVSNGSSSMSSSDTTDDASSLSNSGGSGLYDLSEIMSQLPIKRGLSKFYEGKSESFTSLARVTSIEDLAKKTNPYRRTNNLKASKSCGNGLSSCYKPYSLNPKAIISKKTIKGSCLSKSRKPPLSPRLKNLESYGQ